MQHEEAHKHLFLLLQKAVAHLRRQEESILGQEVTRYWSWDTGALHVARYSGYHIYDLFNGKKMKVFLEH